MRLKAHYYHIVWQDRQHRSHCTRYAGPMDRKAIRESCESAGMVLVDICSVTDKNEIIEMSCACMRG